MSKKVVLLSLLALFFFQPAFAQRSERPQREQFKVTGKVVDHSTNQPMEYATVVLLKPDTEEQVNGIATDVDGRFTISVKKPGRYILRVGFIGFKSEEIKNNFPTL